MHLLYVDESGSVTDASQKYFVLAGVSVFERTTHGIEKSLDEIANKIEPESPQELELHGSPMRSGKGIWRKFDLATREALIVEALSGGVLRQAKGVRLFGCAVEKTALSGKDPVHFCFEQLARRFDLFLQRCHTKHNDLAARAYAFRRVRHRAAFANAGARIQAQRSFLRENT